MEISLLKALLNNISSFLHLLSIDNLSSDLVQKHHQKAEEILKLLKPILDAIVDSEIASDEVLTKAFDELGQSVDELRDLFENWQPLASKVYFVSSKSDFVFLDGSFTWLFDFGGSTQDDLAYDDACLTDAYALS